LASDERGNDEELARKAQAGDREAFAALVRTYEQPIYHLAYRLAGGDAEEARDLAQEIFVRAYTRLYSYDAERPFFPWLYRLGVNYGLNHRRQQRAHPTVRLSEVRRRDEGDQDVDLEIADLTRGPEELSELSEQQAAVNAAIVRLPHDYRAVIALRYGADLDYEEIAATLGIPLGTVKTRLYRAKEALRRELGKER
jgi:RNA polymerase sigma-70 factor, ECF subfamily